MTHNPSQRFAIVPVFGRDDIPHAIAQGPLNVIMERILDSRARNDAIQLTQKAAKAIGTLESVGILKQRERTVKMREDALSSREDAVTRVLLRDALHKLDALTRRMDALEEPEPEEIFFPPGCEPEPEPEETADEDPEAPAPPPAGDLHAVPAKMNGHAAMKSAHDQPEILPRSPAPKIQDPELGSEPEFDPSAR